MHIDADDSDIKIAGEEEPAETEMFDPEELRKQHENGNLSLARELGKILCRKLLSIDGEASFGQDERESEALRSQRRILFAFTACHGIDRYVPDQILRDVTRNAFYNALKSKMPEFYNGLDSAGSFSFYYLCVRQEKNVETEIGKTFAMLTGKKNDPVIEEMGRALFLYFCDSVREAIEDVEFSQIDIKDDDKMDIRQEYERWLASPVVDEATKKELKALKDDETELESRFGSALAFGTAGLRGIMGAGLNRMNVYTVRQATQGLANLIVPLGRDAMARGVAISYDSRHYSDEFAKEAARVLAASGIRVWLFDELRPTPELSFAVRSLHCIAGINVTASHNPKEYNGYKVYWEDGAQLPPAHADVVLKEIRQSDIFRDVRVANFEKAQKEGLISYIGKEIDEKFLASVLSQSISPDAVRAAADSFKIIYTPFHGAGYRLVPEVLRRLGFRHILPVAEQMKLDGDFPTVKSPNPENKEGFAIAIEMAKKENVDLIIGTDPDADRVGIIVRDEAGNYVNLTGNQVGSLLTDYIIRARTERGTMPKNPALVTTIVSSRMPFEICRRHGVTVFEVLTGFKFIGEKIMEFEQSGSHSFLFGFEESYGYLAGTHARDKDAVVGSMLIAEMAAWYRAQGKTLYDAMQDLYKEYGWFGERTVAVNMQGLDAFDRMKATMKRLREESPKEIGGTKVLSVRDYLSEKRTELATGAQTPTGLPVSDVLFYELADGSNVIVRPSGTEPKVKLYVLCKGVSEEQTGALIEKYCDAFRKLMA